MSTTQNRVLICILLVLALINAALYLTLAGEPGFPLDDAWIHQTFARNLGQHGQFAFNLGERSSGSTSPGWTVLLAGGYALGAPPLPWALIWGSLFSILAAWLAAQLSVRYFHCTPAAFLVAIICMLDWRLTWAALSGMEISLFITLTMLYLLLIDRDASPVWLGLLAGLIFTVRPKGLLLAATYFLRFLPLRRSALKPLLQAAGLFALTFMLVAGPLLAANLFLGGRLFPNTVYAKYLAWTYPWTAEKGLRYLGETLVYFVVGPQLFIAPFAALPLVRPARGAREPVRYALLWFAALVLLYALALPVIYHHGRYLMPLIPIVTLFGVEGLRRVAEKFSHWRMLKIAYPLAAGTLLIAFWINGAKTYALQTQLLNANHAQVAFWLRDHTPDNTVIAAHDIGLLGYYSGRPIVDLAGLITPEILPILFEPTAIADLMAERGVEYLVVFRGYYDPLIDLLDAEVIYAPPGTDRLLSLGAAPIEVYSFPTTGRQTAR